ncbi:hypothetical protein BJ875DRAFT_221911 [Amylocarpus encephaloides]|uniref:Uncharacterized protein n=1 Tax=Amylocarpus encephaloides TaxID=45428 RepID=A0A9P7YTU7_9HELO|nr:hypothetical protein BJ875DRAFT_221911 [Amylocarpus encephaloides]
MSPEAIMSQQQASQPTSASSRMQLPFEATEYVTIKEGRLAIFNSDNYGIWSTDITATLSGAAAWQIVIRQEPEPASAPERRDWQARRNIALRILKSSIPNHFWNTIKEPMKAQDPSGVWDALKVHGRATDKLFVNTMKHQFNKLEFNPTNGSIRDDADVG